MAIEDVLEIWGKYVAKRTTKVTSSFLFFFSPHTAQAPSVLTAHLRRGQAMVQGCVLLWQVHEERPTESTIF